MEVSEYEVTKYDPHTCKEGLFSDYINTFLKLKNEASGYPTWVRNPEGEERYVQTFNTIDGLLLVSDAIRPNAAKHGLAKLFLNSLLWKIG
jgi:hypothetical protein